MIVTEQAVYQSVLHGLILSADALSPTDIWPKTDFYAGNDFYGFSPHTR